MPLRQSTNAPSRPSAPRMAQSKGMAYKGAITSTRRTSAGTGAQAGRKDRYSKAVGRKKRITGGASTYGA